MQMPVLVCTTQGGNHIVESVLLTINGVLDDHGVLPQKLIIQLDNAATNKNMIVMAVLGHLVYHVVFSEVRPHPILPLPHGLSELAPASFTSMCEWRRKE